MYKNIKISLVIPTRERAETLKYTIQTALNQKLEEYEVIVSDNFSQDNTKQVVDGFGDSRLRYVNTMQRLSMTENFSFGVSQAKGEYIIVIGDDDGVMPNAIDQLSKFIISHPSKLYVWPRHGYIWPSSHKKSKLERLAQRSQPEKIDLREQLKSTLKKGLCLNSRMPNTYHSATHCSIFEEIKRQTGQYYQTTNPDEFMLFTLPVFSEFTVNIGYALTANGHSVKSNSGRQLNTEKKSTKNELGEVEKFISEYGEYKLHQSIPSDFPTTACFVMDTFLRVRDLYPKHYANYNINYSGMWAYAWQIFNLKNLLEPVKRRKELQEYEAFNAITYLTFSLLFFVYLKIIKKVAPQSKQEKAVQNIFNETPPNDINEFVNFINKLKLIE